MKWIGRNAILDGNPQTCFIIEYALHTFTLNIETTVPRVNVTIYTYDMNCEQSFHYKVYTVVPDRCSSVARTLCSLEMVEKWDGQIDDQSAQQRWEINKQGQKCTFKCSAVCNTDMSQCEIHTINIQVASIKKGYICELELSYEID